MRGEVWMGIRSDRQKGLSYVELGKKYHMDRRTAKQYAESPERLEYTLSEPKPTKMDPFKPVVDELVGGGTVFSKTDPGKAAGDGT